jgi:hypothetical protein
MLSDWISHYERKTGETFRGWPHAELAFDAECGFCVSIQDGDILLIGEVCGNGRYWLRFLVQKARELGCTKVRFGTYRNPAAFTRKYGFEVTGFIDGMHVLEKGVID